MAKGSYHIPESIDASPLDVEVAIRSDSGMGMRPLPLRFIFAVLLAGLLWFWVMNVTFVSTMSLLFKVLFSITWLFGALLLVRMDKSGTLMISRIPVLIDYFPRSSRHVSCRTNDNAGPFYSIANIANVDDERGIIEFADGDLGKAYRIVGSASILLFPEDQEAILDRTDAFYRNMKSDYEIIYITCKEAQNVKRQLRNMDARLVRLRNDDPDLRALAEMERYFLENHVGRSYRSTHQYMILKAHSEESLGLAENALRSEVEYSTLMIKRCAALYDDELRDMFRTVFRGRETA